MAAIERAGGLTRGAISEAVARVLASDAFGKSKRLRRFFSYIVEKTLAGEFDNLKEYSIALAVFDRDSAFNPATDTIVRVEAGRLRNKLAAYYHGPGSHDPVVIDLPRGGYVAEFRVRGQESPAGAVRRFFHRPASYGRAGGVLMVLLAGLLLWRLFPGPRIPHAWTVEGSTLRVVDAAGRFCWEKHFPLFDVSFSSQVVDKALIGDIDQDGRIEVLFNLLLGDGGAVAGSLLCFDQSGHQRWKYQYGGDAPSAFGGRTFDPGYRGRLIRLVTVGGKRRLLTVANHYLWYPSQVALLILASPGRKTTKAPNSCEAHSVTSFRTASASRGRAEAGNRIRITPGESMRPANTSQPKSLSSVRSIRSSASASSITSLSTERC